MPLNSLEFLNRPHRTGAVVKANGVDLILSDSLFDLLVRLVATVLSEQPYATSRSLDASGNLLQQRVSRLRTAFSRVPGVEANHPVVVCEGKGCYRLNVQTQGVQVSETFSELAQHLQLEFRFWNVLDEWSSRTERASENQRLIADSEHAHVSEVLAPLFTMLFEYLHSTDLRVRKLAADRLRQEVADCATLLKPIALQNLARRFEEFAALETHPPIAEILRSGAKGLFKNFSALGGRMSSMRCERMVHLKD